VSYIQIFTHKPHIHTFMCPHFQLHGLISSNKLVTKMMMQQIRRNRTLLVSESIDYVVPTIKCCQRRGSSCTAPLSVIYCKTRSSPDKQIWK